MRRRIVLMRHAAVAYVVDGQPVPPDGVELTPAGREQAEAARDLLDGIAFDRVVTSGLARTIETARIVAPQAEPAAIPAFVELRTGRFADLEDPEHEFVTGFRGVASEERRFLGGESFGELYDRVVPALEELLADESWDQLLAVFHGGVNRALISYALTGGRTFLGNFEQAPACINVLDVGPDWRDGPDWVVRGVNLVPYGPLHARSRLTTMEELWLDFRELAP